MNRKKHGLFNDYKKIVTGEFRGYCGLRLLKDVLAGITVAAVSLPLALAFGAASVTPEYVAVGILAGLITAVTAGIVASLLGGGSFQISGPSSAMTAVLGGVVGGKYGLAGLFLACFIAGLFLITAGLLKLGRLMHFIPKPVITGFTSGLSITIATGQLGNFFGVTVTGDSIVGKFAYFFSTQLTNINIAALICSVVAVIIMALYPKKFSKYVPGSLVALVVITASAALLKLDVSTIGSIPSTLINTVRLDFSLIDFEMLSGVIGTAFTIAALCMLESLLCGACASDIKKEDFDPNVELAAHGISNLIVPFLGGLPSASGFARTSVALKSGGQTRLTCVFHSLFIIVCMFFLSDAIGIVPYPVLSGILVVTAWKMNDWEEIKYFFSHKIWDSAVMFLATMLATVLLGLVYAILIGVVIALIMMMTRLSRIKLECTAQGEGNAAVIRIGGAFFFANAGEAAKYISDRAAGYDEYIISLGGVTYIDSTAAAALREALHRLHDGGKAAVITHVSSAAMPVLARAGLVGSISIADASEVG